jgi:hypothetical protein
VRRLSSILPLLVCVRVADAEVANYHGTTTDNHPSRQPKRTFTFDVELTYWRDMLGYAADDSSHVETSCPPGPDHSCTSTNVCTRSARFGVEDLKITLADPSGKTLSRVQTSYPIETKTRSSTPADKSCSVDWPTVAAPGTIGADVDVYLKISERERFHLTLQPRAILGAKSDRAGYLLEDLVLAKFDTSEAIDFTLESRPDVKHPWNAEGTSGWILVSRGK